MSTISRWECPECGDWWSHHCAEMIRHPALGDGDVCPGVPVLREYVLREDANHPLPTTFFMEADGVYGQRQYVAVDALRTKIDETEAIVDRNSIGHFKNVLEQDAATWATEMFSDWLNAAIDAAGGTT